MADQQLATSKGPKKPCRPLAVSRPLTACRLRTLPVQGNVRIELGMTGQALPGGTSVERLRELDGWRGVLAIAVASYHFNVQALPVSYVAVDLFFMLSG